MRNLILCFFILSSFQIFGQNANLVKDGNAYVNAIIEKDFGQALNYTHPNIVEMGGGTEFVKGLMEQDREMLEKSNIKYISGSIGEHTDIIKAESELHCIVSQAIILSVGDRKVKSFSNLLAASLDNGETWKFVNLDEHDSESIKVFVPSFNSELVIPPVKPSENIE